MTERCEHTNLGVFAHGGPAQIRCNLEVGHDGGSQCRGPDLLDGGRVTKVDVVLYPSWMALWRAQVEAWRRDEEDTDLDENVEKLKAPSGDIEPVELLREWFRWWSDTDDAPAKMPHALHVRTATYLAVRHHIKD